MAARSTSLLILMFWIQPLHLVSGESGAGEIWLTAKATGTAEPGGWSTRELLSILDGLSGLEVIGADIGEHKAPWNHQRVLLTGGEVEVSPVWDNAGETTVLAAAQVADSLLTLMVQKPVKSTAEETL